MALVFPELVQFDATVEKWWTVDCSLHIQRIKQLEFEYMALDHSLDCLVTCSARVETAAASCEPNQLSSNSTRIAAKIASYELCDCGVKLFTWHVPSFQVGGECTHTLFTTVKWSLL